MSKLNKTKRQGGKPKGDKKTKLGGTSHSEPLSASDRRLQQINSSVLSSSPIIGKPRDVILNFQTLTSESDAPLSFKKLIKNNHLANLIYPSRSEYTFFDDPANPDEASHNYRVLVHSKHNLDHLALHCVLDAGDEFGERPLYEIFKGVTSSLTPDLVVKPNLRKGELKPVVLDVTTGNLEQSHSTKKSKYEFLVSDGHAQSYITVIVNNYSFLDFYEPIYNEFRNILFDARIELENTFGYELLMAVARDLTSMDFKVCPVYPVSHALQHKVRMKKYFGVEDIKDWEIAAPETDYEFIKYLHDNIDFLIGLQYPENENLSGFIKDHINNMSDLPNLDSKGITVVEREAMTLRLPIIDPVSIIDVPQEYIDNDVKDQYRIGALYDIMSRVFSHDKSELSETKKLLTSLAVKSSIANTYANHTISYRSDILREREEVHNIMHSKNYKTAVSLLHFITNIKLSMDQVRVSDQDAREWAKFYNISSSYDLGMRRRKVLEVQEMLINNFAKRLETLDLILTEKQLVNIMEMNKGGYRFKYNLYKSQEKQDIHKVVSKVTTDEDVLTVENLRFMKNGKLKTSSQTTQYIREFLNVGLTKQERNERRKRKANIFKCIKYSDKDSDRCEALLDYLSESAYPIYEELLISYDNNIEEEITGAYVRPYLKAVTQTRAYRYLKGLSEIAQKISYAFNRRCSPNELIPVNDPTGNCLLFITGGNLNERSIFGFNATRTPTPENLWKLFNIEDIIQDPYSGLYLEVIMPFTLREVVLDRWLDGDTFVPCATSEDYFRMKAKHIGLGKDKVERNNFNRIFFKDIFALRTVVYCECKEATAKILESIRYLVMNSIATYSNSRQFIEEKLIIQPRNPLQCYIYKCIRDYMQEQPYESAKHSRDNINMPMVFSRNLISYSLQDILSDLFLVYFTCPNTYTQFYAFKEHFKTLLEFRRKRLARSRDQTTCKMEDRMKIIEETWKTYYIFDPRIVSRAFELLLGTVKEKYMKTHRSRSIRLYDDTLLDHVNTKSMVIPHDIKDPELLEMLKVFHMTKDPDVHKNVLDKIRSNPKLRDNGRLIDQFLLFSIRNGNMQWGDMMMHFIDHDFYCGIRDKETEKGKLREFGCPGFSFRVGLKFIEMIAESVCKLVDFEMISKGGKKGTYMIKGLDTLLSSSENKKVMYANIDHTKWSAAMCIEIFMLMSAVMYKQSFISLDEFKWMIHYLDKLDNKRILVDMNLLTSFTSDPIVKEIDSILDPSTLSFQLPGNWIQGKLNKFSSLLHCAKSYYTYHIVKNVLECDNIEAVFRCHSDDGSTALAYEPHTIPKYFQDKWPKHEDSMFKIYRAIEVAVAICLNMFESSKKTSENPLICEFISIFYANGDMNTAIFKGTANLTTRVSLDLYPQVYKDFYSVIFDAFQKGATLSSLKVMQRFIRVILKKLYNYTHQQIEDYIDKPFELGGVYEGPLFPVLLRGLDSIYVTRDQQQLGFLHELAVSSSEEEKGNYYYTATNSFTISPKKYKDRLEELLEEAAKTTGYSNIVLDSMDFMAKNPQYTWKDPTNPREQLLKQFSTFMGKSIKQSYLRLPHYKRFILTKALYFGKYTQFELHGTQYKTNFPMFVHMLDEEYEKYSEDLENKFEEFEESLDDLREEGLSEKAINAMRPKRFSCRDIIQFPIVDSYFEWAKSAQIQGIIETDKIRKSKFKTYTKYITGDHLRNDIAFVYSLFMGNKKLIKEVTRPQFLLADTSYLKYYFETRKISSGNFEMIFNIHKLKKNEIDRYTKQASKDYYPNKFVRYYELESHPLYELRVASRSVRNETGLHYIKIDGDPTPISDNDIATVVNAFNMMTKQGLVKDVILEAFRNLVIQHTNIDDNYDEVTVKARFEDIIRNYHDALPSVLQLTTLDKYVIMIGMYLYNLDPLHLVDEYRPNPKPYMYFDDEGIPGVNIIGEDYKIEAHYYGRKSITEYHEFFETNFHDWKLVIYAEPTAKGSTVLNHFIKTMKIPSSSVLESKNTNYAPFVLRYKDGLASFEIRTRGLDNVNITSITRKMSARVSADGRVLLIKGSSFLKIIPLFSFSKGITLDEDIFDYEPPIQISNIMRALQVGDISSIISSTDTIRIRQGIAETIASILELTDEYELDRNLLQRYYGELLKVNLGGSLTILEEAEDTGYEDLSAEEIAIKEALDNADNETDLRKFFNTFQYTLRSQRAQNVINEIAGRYQQLQEREIEDIATGELIDPDRVMNNYTLYNEGRITSAVINNFEFELTYTEETQMEYLFSFTQRFIFKRAKSHITYQQFLSNILVQEQTFLVLNIQKLLLDSDYGVLDKYKTVLKYHILSSYRKSIVELFTMGSTLTIEDEYDKQRLNMLLMFTAKEIDPELLNTKHSVGKETLGDLLSDLEIVPVFKKDSTTPGFE